MNRRDFLRTTSGLALGTALSPLMANSTPAASPKKRPNLVFIFSDQWRAQACGYAGPHRDLNALTPNADRLASQSVNFQNAISGMSVCSPYRASMLTGMHPLHHGVFINSTRLNPALPSIGKSLKSAGYQTGWIGKWHVDGHYDDPYIPAERRHGFDFWRTMEVNHNYEVSPYYSEIDRELRHWAPPYDAFPQTDTAVDFIRGRAQSENPFALFLSWGPPHDPYWQVPQKYKDLHPRESLQFRDNVPDAFRRGEERMWDTPLAEHLQGYLAHCSALDEALGRILAVLDSAGIADNTLLVFTSDHGDMMGSQGQKLKQKPYEESCRVPFLLRFPSAFGSEGRTVNAPIDAPDILPTLLGLLGLSIPDTAQGVNYAPYLHGQADDPKDGAGLLSCIIPFGSWSSANGGRAYRGVRTARHTYVRDLNGPWLLFDNQEDPFQLHNRADDPALRALRTELEDQLRGRLAAVHDPFEPGEESAKKWGYTLHPRTNRVEAYTRPFSTSPYL